MEKRQFRVLYREFLFRMVELDVLSSYAKGDASQLMGRFAALLVSASVLFVLPALGLLGVQGPGAGPMMAIWTMEHFLIATTMLVVGLFAVLSWDSTFPGHRDVLVVAPLPVRARTMFLAKIAAVSTALAITVVLLHSAAGLVWPFALANKGVDSAPAMTFDATLPPLGPAELETVLQRDLGAVLRHGTLAQPDIGAVVAIWKRGERRLLTYGAANPDSLFEIGSISKTFTGLLLARLVEQGSITLFDPVRELLPPGTVRMPRDREITLVDLATQHSGLPVMPDNIDTGDRSDPAKANPYANYHAADLYQYMARHGVERDGNPGFLYSNLGFALLGQALAARTGLEYAELLRREITGPLGLKDTVVDLSDEQAARLLPGHAGRHIIHRWDMDALAGAGGIRSTAGDMLTYMEAQLHPVALESAIHQSHLLRNNVTSDTRIALAWFWSRSGGYYYHDGMTGGFSTYAFFHPKSDYAGIVMANQGLGAMPLGALLGMHVRQRMAGEPAFSLDTVPVAGTSGVRGVVRAFFAFWLTMAMAGAFIYCCVLGLQGLAAQAMPRRWFLRASALMQVAVFCLFIITYFLQPSPAAALIAGPNQPWSAWIPTYWFVGLFQQLNGTLHPALAPFATRAWVGFGAAFAVTLAAYTLSYLRSIRQIVETPDIVPAIRSDNRLPRFGGALTTAIVQFSIRTLLRSRQHRMLLAFYLGLGFALCIVLLKTPASQQIAGEDATLPLIAATIGMMAFAVIGMRVVFAMPLELGSNWLFRSMPIASCVKYLRARRAAMFTLAVAPVVVVTAAVLFVIWPWRVAAGHTAVLTLTGIILVELCLTGVQKIPFTCSYLPGKSNFHVTFWMSIVYLSALVMKGAEWERQALESAGLTAVVLSGLAGVWAAIWWRNRRDAEADETGPLFDEAPADRIQTLDLS